MKIVSTSHKCTDKNEEKEGEEKEGKAKEGEEKEGEEKEGEQKKGYQMLLAFQPPRPEKQFL